MSTTTLPLQQCTACGAVQYPPRELCATCLADAPAWRSSDTELGEVLAICTLRHSHDAAFRARLPLQVALVRLDVGPTVVCFVADDCAGGMRVRVTAELDREGRTILTAAIQPRATAAAPSR